MDHAMIFIIGFVTGCYVGVELNKWRIRRKCWQRLEEAAKRIGR